MVATNALIRFVGNVCTPKLTNQINALVVTIRSHIRNEKKVFTIFYKEYLTEYRILYIL